MTDNLSSLPAEPGSIHYIDNKKVSVYSGHVKLADGKTINADETGMVEVYGATLSISPRPCLIYERKNVENLTIRQIEDMPFKDLLPLLESRLLRFLSQEKTDAFISAFNEQAEEQMGPRKKYRLMRQAELLASPPPFGSRTNPVTAELVLIEYWTCPITSTSLA